MAIKFLQTLDLQGNEIQNFKAHVASSDSGFVNAGEGSIWLDSANNTLKFYVADTGGGSAGWLSVLDDTNDNSTTFTLTADSGTNQTIGHGNTLDIAGGASITTSVGNTDTVTIDVTDNTIGAAELNVSGNGDNTKFLRSDGDGSFSWVVPTDTNTDTNTQNVFVTSFVDSSNDCILRLTKSGASSGTQDVKFVAGSNITLTPSGTNLTIASSHTNSQNVFTSSFVDSGENAVLRLTKSGAASGTQDITFVAGSNIDLTPAANGTSVEITATDTNTQLNNAQVRAAVAAATDSNVFTNADHTKLDDISSSADVTTAATVKTALGGAMSSNTLAIGDGNTTTTFAGNIIVTGTTTTAEETVKVIENNTIQFEGAAGSTATTELNFTTAQLSGGDKTVTLPNKSGTVAMVGDLIANTDTQNAYTISVENGSNTSREKIQINGSGAAGSTTDFIEIAAGTGMSIAKSGDVITLNNLVTNVNTQNVFVTSFVDSSDDCILRLTKSGAASGTQDIKFVAGDNVTLTPSGSNLTITATDTTIAARTAGNGITLTSNSLSVTQFTGALAAATSGIAKSSNTYTVTHGLGNVRVNVIVTTVASPFEQVFPEINYTNAAGNGTVKVIFGQTVSDSDYNVTVTR